MKKTYIAPSMEVAATAANEIICASVVFGEGNTDVMNAPEQSILGDDELLNLVD